MLEQRNLSDVGSDVGLQTSASITSIRHAAHDAIKALQQQLNGCSLWFAEAMFTLTQVGKSLLLCGENQTAIIGRE